MNIKLELLKNFITYTVSNYFENLEIDADKITDTIAVRMLAEIQEIIRDEEISDFDAIEKIVCVFEENKIDFGVRHDF